MESGAADLTTGGETRPALTNDQSGSDEGTGLAGAPASEALTQYTLEEVRDHWERSSCWIILYDFVYDITDFLQEHPGGTEILIEHAGRDSTVAFKGKGHSEEAHGMLQRYCIGQLVPAERIYTS